MPKAFTYLNEKEYKVFQRTAKELGISEYQLLQISCKVCPKIKIKIYLKETGKEFWDIMSKAP